MRNVTVGQVARTAFLIDYFYDEGPGHGFNPVVDAIEVRDLTVGKARQAYYLVGYSDDHIGEIGLTNCSFQAVTKPAVVQYVDDLDIRNVTVNGQPVPESTEAGEMVGV